MMTLPPHTETEAGWLMFHSVGRFPGQQAALSATLDAFAAEWCGLNQARWGGMDAARTQMLELWGRLVNAPQGTVLAAENVTSAFYTLVQGLGAARLAGRTVLIAADCFPSLHFMLTQLAPRLGFTLRTVPVREGADWVHDDDFVAMWGPEVALAIVTWVTSTASHRSDVARMVAHGRAQGSLIAVDITQGVGILPFDVQAADVDFAACTAMKWLCGVPGAGTAYLAPSLIAALEPSLAGWFSQPNPFSWDLDAFSFAADARRFDNGTPSYLPYIGSLPGLQWHAGLPEGALRAHNLTLCHQLIAIADRHGLRLVSPRADNERGGTVVIEVPEHVAPEALQQRLEREQIHCDTRGRRMRWSPGGVTTAGMLDHLDAVLADVL